MEAKIPLYIRRRPYLQDQIFHTLRTEIRDFLTDLHRKESKIPRRLSLRCHGIERRHSCMLKTNFEAYFDTKNISLT